MNFSLKSLKAFLLLTVTISTHHTYSQSTTSSKNHQHITTLFKEWRLFEKPPLREGAPDYTAETFKRRYAGFKKLQEKLLKTDTTGWTSEEQVDWYVIWAEMNGFDFNYRILKPWERDPAFYKSLWDERSDVPAHEGPTHHAITDLWTYKFPLSQAERSRLLADLKVIVPLNKQAKENLKGNAKELWITGIRDIRTQSDDLKNIIDLPGIKDDVELTKTITAAIQSTDELTAWLEKEAIKKTGPSGIGKENYNWYMKNVHLVPLTWDDQVMLLKRELARAWSSLKLEEHRNRQLPELADASTAEAYQLLAERSVKSIITFLDKQDIVTVKEYFEPAMKAHMGKFVPKEKRNFFLISSHYDPRPLFSHFYHWFELARMDLEPNECEVRRGPLLYNIFDTRNEGMATMVEETFMQTGMYNDDPRVREIVYILLAQRAARGLGSLYAHANEMTMEEAGSIHADYTPRGWMKTEKKLRIFEQSLYLRQPGYGTCYLTGKYLIENAMAAYARELELQQKSFHLKDFLNQFNEYGNIPPVLGEWLITGNGSEVRKMLK